MSVNDYTVKIIQKGKELSGREPQPNLLSIKMHSTFGIELTNNADHPVVVEMDHGGAPILTGALYGLAPGQSAYISTVRFLCCGKYVRLRFGSVVTSCRIQLRTPQDQGSSLGTIQVAFHRVTHTAKTAPWLFRPTPSCRPIEYPKGTLLVTTAYFPLPHTTQHVETQNALMSTSSDGRFRFEYDTPKGVEKRLYQIQHPEPVEPYTPPYHPRQDPNSRPSGH